MENCCPIPSFPLIPWLMFDFITPGRGELESVFWHREQLKEYTPKSLQASISPKALHSHVATLLRARQPLQPQEAKIQFIGEETSRSASVPMLFQLLEAALNALGQFMRLLMILGAWNEQ